MTYTMMGRCSQTGRVGYALATVSLNVGSVCPAVSRSGDLIVSQAYTNRTTKAEGARRLDEGMEAAALMAHLASLDPHFAYRQVGILPRKGNHAVHSGDACSGWNGHRTGDDWIAMGNVLAGEQVVTAMGDRFAADPQEPLAERLMAALEAGRDAGGQVDGEGRHYTERSARLATYGWDDEGYPELTEVDVRVDVHATAVAELRRQFVIIGPLSPFQHLKSDDPSTLMNPDEWEDLNVPARPPRHD
ncbi:MAG: DUF1028 domain-containing protein [Acidimicrobiales bacterium]|jgi:uncharacterized Ntn-hydrolase superfamily protein